MAALDKPPLSEPMFDKNGVMTTIWKLWFEKLYAIIKALP